MKVRLHGWRALAAVGLLGLSSTGARAEERVSVEMEMLHVEARTELLLRELEELNAEVQTLKAKIGQVANRRSSRARLCGSNAPPWQTQRESN